MTTHGDRFAPQARVRRIAAWGDTPAAAGRSARKVVTELSRRIERELPLVDRHAPGAVPQVPASRLADSAAGAALPVPGNFDDGVRAAYSLGKSYPDLLAARGTRLDRAADVVLRPDRESDIAKILAWAGEHDVVVVPVGGGSSVVGGIEPLSGTTERPVAALDLTALTALRDLDTVSGLATFEAGVSGPALERALAPHHLTLGHMPQSFHYSTLGGWVVTRSAGQASLAYGSIDSMLRGAAMETPSGRVVAEPVPAHAAGISGAEFALGSEGTFGVLTRATVRVRPRPEKVRFASFAFHSFEAACAGASQLIRSGLKPAVLRISDNDESAFLVASSLPARISRDSAGRFARAIGLGSASLVFCVFHGSGSGPRRSERAVSHLLRRHGAHNVGALPCKEWYRQRFVQPYVRDLLMDHGLLVDTLETAATWANLQRTHSAVRTAIRVSLGPEALVGCHVSHVYDDGASLYFTVIAPQRQGDALAQWREMKLAANDAIIVSGSAPSHHHGIGVAHTHAHRAFAGEPLLAALRAAKDSFDPQGVMNPGKIFAPDAPRAAINC